MLVVELLLLDVGSPDAEVTRMVLVSVIPVATTHSTMPMIVMTPCAPGLRDEKETVTSLPEPPHIPEVVDEHEKRLTPGGRLSVTTTDCPASGPAFLTVIV